MTNETKAKCELCGEPMPKGEEMFTIHGYSGPCPKPPLQAQSQGDPPATKEYVYDTQINPLMAEVLAICKQHKIAMVASFAIPNCTDQDLVCSSALTTDEFNPPEIFRKMVSMLYQ